MKTPKTKKLKATPAFPAKYKYVSLDPEPTPVIVVGQSVWLVSGGPEMTVERIETIVSCSWVDANGVVNRADFPAPCVK